eukprot:12265593-Alexandrium_andersonii.AAC.1
MAQRGSTGRGGMASHCPAATAAPLLPHASTWRPIREQLGTASWAEPPWVISKMAAEIGSCSTRSSAIMLTDNPEALKRSIEYVKTVSTGVPGATQAGSARFHFA